VCEDGSKLNGTRQLLACAYVANSMDENIHISEKIKEKLSCSLSADTSRRKFRENWMYVHASGTDAEWCHSIKIGGKCFEILVNSDIGNNINKSNCIHEENDRRLSSANSCYISPQNRSSSSLFCQKKWYFRTIIFFCIYRCQIWSLTLREEYRLKGFRQKMLKKTCAE